MASSYNRKSSSSASSPGKPTFRKPRPAGKGKAAPAGKGLGRATSRAASSRCSKKGRVQPAPKAPRAAAASRSAARPKRKARPAGAGRRRLPALPSLGFPLKKVGLLAGALAGIAAVLGIVFVIVANTGLFAVTEVEFVASDHVPQETARSMVSIPEGATLLNVDEGAIADQLKLDPWVKGVDVKREFPHKLVVTPTEHAVTAIAYISTADVAWAVSDEGTWIAPVSLGTQTGTLDASGDEAADGERDAPASDGGSSDEGDGAAADDGEGSGSGSSDGGSSDSSSSSKKKNKKSSGTQSAQEGYDAAAAIADELGALLISDIGTDVSPKSGEAVDSEGVSAALEYAQGFSEDFRSQVKSFSAESEESLALFTKDGVEVALGAPDDIAYKETVVKRILSEYENVTYINVRTPDSPTWRSVTT